MLEETGKVREAGRRGQTVRTAQMVRGQLPETKITTS
jgi:hypothetical protein